MTDGHHFNNILLGGRGGTVSFPSLASADAFPISRVSSRVTARCRNL
jgi:hypothetical protein